MRRTTFGLFVTGAVALAGCGSGARFVNQHRPPTPIDLTVYINDMRVSVSPASVGAGPVIFFVTNQASKTESLTVLSQGGSQVASTGPINPQATAQVTVDFSTGDYKIATGAGGVSDAAAATGNAIHPAKLHIGPNRTPADSALLQP